MIAHAGLRIFQNRHEVLTVDGLWSDRSGQSGQCSKRGIQVHRLGGLTSHAAGPGDTGCHDEDGDAVGLFVVRVFGPDAEIAKVPSVIAPQDDDGVLLEAQSLQRGGHATDLRIDVSRAGVVAVDQLPRQRLAHLPVHRHGCVRGNFPRPFQGHRRGVLGKGFDGGHRQLGGIKQIPVFFRRRKRQMRPHETGRDKERRPILDPPRLGGFQPANGLGGHPAIGVIVILGLRRLKRRPAW